MVTDNAKKEFKGIILHLRYLIIKIIKLVISKKKKKTVFRTARLDEDLAGSRKYTLPFIA